jgi:hypothetical protein
VLITVKLLEEKKKNWYLGKNPKPYQKQTVKIEKGKKQILMKIASLELLYPLTQIDFGGEKYESNRYTSEKLYNIFIILSIKHAANIA